MKKSLLAVLLLLQLSGFCQIKDSLSTITLNEVTVTSYKEKPVAETSFNITPIKADSLSTYGNFNLTGMIARVPGVSMLSTGVGIAKPVIRGLYGNRVLVLLSGLKFDNQQWQEEHGMGLSDFGLSRVELIKGPMSVLYGTEALGGIINLVEEEKPLPGTKEGDVAFRFNSNTRGGMLQGGLKVNTGNKWWRLRAGIENHADYTDGNDNRVLNSRFDGYYFKGTYGFQKNHWTSTNNFMSSFNRYGFIFNDIYTFITPDDRWSRKLDTNPAHLVLLNILSSENKFTLKNNSRLNLNIGVQSNERMENEGGGAISLNMHLLTVQYLLKWEKTITEHSRLVLSNLGSFEDNTNFGARKIVPDANMQESNVSAFLETTINNELILENGVGIGEKWIKTYFTATVNGPEKEVQPFNKFSVYYNAFSGMTYIPNKAFNLKLNAATGVRIPNLAELSSNGLHEGVFTYEIGNPDMKNEQNVAINLQATYENGILDFSISPFYNYFFDYVYLTPTNEEWFGFPVYRYKQQNATQYGTELTLTVTPAEHLRTGLSYSGMVSKTEDGEYTPFVPAQKISPNISYHFETTTGRVYRIFSHIDYFLAQDNVAPNEISTPGYWLWDLGASTSFEHNGKEYMISISGHNLLNKAYYDHLSRFKYFDLLNIGRNIDINLKVKFGKQRQRN